MKKFKRLLSNFFLIHLPIILGIIAAMYLYMVFITVFDYMLKVGVIKFRYEWIKYPYFLSVGVLFVPVWDALKNYYVKLSNKGRRALLDSRRLEPWVNPKIQPIFTNEFLDDIGFYRDFENTTDLYKYGRAVDKKGGMTIISWNNEGRSLTYRGNPLKPNVSVTIYKDAGTRTVFNGYVFNAKQLKLLLELTN